jgi:hypothetical protein
MKSYRVDLQQIHVYETCEIRPRDAVAAVGDEATICFVDRVLDASGLPDRGAMSEAIDRHCRLKIAPQGPYALHFADLTPDRAYSFWSWAHAWTLFHPVTVLKPSPALGPF